jgi:hypothetical protein
VTRRATTQVSAVGRGRRQERGPHRKLGGGTEGQRRDMPDGTKWLFQHGGVTVRRVRRRDELLGLGSAVASGARCSGFGRAVKLDAKLWCAASARRGFVARRQSSCLVWRMVGSSVMVFCPLTARSEACELLRRARSRGLR